MERAECKDDDEVKFLAAPLGIRSQGFVNTVSRDMTGSQVSWSTEQLFYFSFPGQVFLILLAAWAFLAEKLVLSTGIVATAVVSSVPLGFILYQAYTSGALWVYRIVWYGRASEAGVKRVMRALNAEQLKQSDPKEYERVYRKAKRIVTYLNNSDPHGAYLWRLIGFVNSRGACILAIFVASLVPTSFHVLASYSTRFAELNLELSSLDYYVFSALASMMALCLWWGIPKIRSQIEQHSEIIIIQNQSKLEELGKAFTEAN